MILIAAGLFETLFAFCLAKARTVPASESLYWYGGFLLSLIISMWLLIVATRSLPIGTAYAVWTGIGAFGTVVMGILFFREPVTFWRMLFLFTLVASIVGLKFVSN